MDNEEYRDLVGEAIGCEIFRIAGVAAVDVEAFTTDGMGGANCFVENSVGKGRGFWAVQVMWSRDYVDCWSRHSQRQVPLCDPDCFETVAGMLRGFKI